jgi:hypothetical protein
MDLHAKAPFRRDKRAKLRNRNLCNALQTAIFIRDEDGARMLFRNARRMGGRRDSDEDRCHRFAASARRFCAE